MQVGSMTAPIVGVPYVKIVGNTQPPAEARGLAPMSAGARAALNHIAGSTRLNDNEKRAFIRLLADIDQYAGGDPKLILKVMGIVMLAESMHPEGTYRGHAQTEVDKMYWDDRINLSQEPLPDTTAIPPAATESTALNVMA